MNVLEIFFSPCICREELVSTMDAEHALRDQRREIPYLKASGPRTSGIVTAEGKGKPFILDPVALKVWKGQYYETRP